MKVRKTKQHTKRKVRNAPTSAQISAVMAHLGRIGNLGRKKAMTPAEHRQRCEAAARRGAKRTPEEPGGSAIPAARQGPGTQKQLAQSDSSGERDSRRKQLAQSESTDV